jgi:phosphatidylinositol alpha-1,6-mannosyltransferase
VSKPIAPPWNDGSKNLVRDVAASLTRARPTVLTVEGAEPIGERVRMEAVYAARGRFAPSIMANARVLGRLLTGDPHDVWHFVFAPNPASSAAAMLAQRTRGLLGWRGRIVQTIASAPRSFEGIGRWVFGDVVVALSDWTRGRLLGAGVHDRDVRVIPPCARAPRRIDDAEASRTRERYALGSGPVVLYPGDYEVSRGAQTVARAVPAVLKAVPEATIVFACRQKTPRAADVRESLVAELRPFERRVRHLGEVSDMAALLGVASVIAFPVDDLFAKVDLPLVLLEALALGIPMVVARGGPLEALSSAAMCEPADDAGLARALVDLLRGGPRADEQREQGRELYRARFTPEAVAAAYEELYAPQGG